MCSSDYIFLYNLKNWFGFFCFLFLLLKRPSISKLCVEPHQICLHVYLGTRLKIQISRKRVAPLLQIRGFYTPLLTIIRDETQPENSKWLGRGSAKQVSFQEWGWNYVVGSDQAKAIFKAIFKATFKQLCVSNMGYVVFWIWSS